MEFSGEKTKGVNSGREYDNYSPQYEKFKLTLIQGGGIRTSLRFCCCCVTVAILMIVSIILAILLVSAVARRQRSKLCSTFDRLAWLSTVLQSGQILYL